MPKRTWLALALACGGGTGAITVRDIPALPLSRGAAANSTHDPLYPSGYRRSQLEAAWDAVGETGIPGIQNRSFDAVVGRLVVPVASEAQRTEVLRGMKAAGLPVEIVRFAQGPALPGVSTSLPSGPRLAQPHRARLNGPATLTIGTTGVWTLRLTNTGQALPIHLKNGACDLHFEVWNAAGVLVRPVPTSRTCTDQLIRLDVAPRETRDVLSVRWDGRNGLGQPLPPGAYTLLGVYWNGTFAISPPPARVTLR